MGAVQLAPVPPVRDLRGTSVSARAILRLTPNGRSVDTGYVQHGDDVIELKAFTNLHDGSKSNTRLSESAYTGEHAV